MSKKAFILIGVFWLLIIGGLVGYKEYTLFTGQEVLLRTVPVDPRDLFRGDYVILRYEISTLDPEVMKLGNPPGWVGSKVYVTLEVEDGYGRATRLWPTVMKPDGLFIHGKVKSASDSEMHIEYGIESFFVPEGEGKLIERQRQSGLDVRVVIDKYGTAVIKSLVVEGEDLPF